MSNFNQSDDQYYNSSTTTNVDQDMASPSQNSPMGGSSTTASSQPKSGSSTETSGQVMNVIMSCGSVGKACQPTTNTVLTSFRFWPSPAYKNLYVKSIPPNNWTKKLKNYCCKSLMISLKILWTLLVYLPNIEKWPKWKSKMSNCIWVGFSFDVTKIFLLTVTVDPSSERNWNMWIPGFGTDELRPYKRATVTEAHKQRLALIRKAIKKYWKCKTFIWSKKKWPRKTQQKKSSPPQQFKVHFFVRFWSVPFRRSMLNRVEFSLRHQTFHSPILVVWLDDAFLLHTCPAGLDPILWWPKKEMGKNDDRLPGGGWAAVMVIVVEYEMAVDRIRENFQEIICVWV